MNETIIAITMRTSNAHEYYEPRLAISVDWMDYLTHINCLPVLIPTVSKISGHCFDRSNAEILLLTGGDDVQIRLCAEFSSFQENHTGSERDISEMGLIKKAIDNGVPIIGVCRGFQLLNLYFGGKLGLLSDQEIARNHSNGEHWIEIVDSKFQTLLGAEKIKVNSFHRFGIQRHEIGRDLIVAGVSGDGLVEAFYHSKLPIIALQWHPERDENFESSASVLIRKFIESKGLC